MFLFIEDIFLTSLKGVSSTDGWFGAYNPCISYEVKDRFPLDED